MSRHLTTENIDELEIIQQLLRYETFEYLSLLSEIIDSHPQDKMFRLPMTQVCNYAREYYCSYKTTKEIMGHLNGNFVKLLSNFLQTMAEVIAINSEGENKRFYANSSHGQISDDDTTKGIVQLLLDSTGIDADTLSDAFQILATQVQKPDRDHIQPFEYENGLL